MTLPEWGADVQSRNRSTSRSGGNWGDYPMDRRSRARIFPDADAGMKSSTLNAGAGTSCPMSTIALTFNWSQ